MMGSRPDGWWRDRAGAARRLVDQIGELALIGVTRLPESVPAPAIDRWFPHFVVVLEGAAAAMADPGGSASASSAGSAASASSAGSAASASSAGSGDAGDDSQPRIVRARGSGDDEIVRQAAGIAGPRLVVTADRELRSRCEAVGAFVVGPRWLLDLL